MNNFRWLWKYVRQVKSIVISTVVIGLLEMACDLGITGIQKFIIDDVFVGRQYDLTAPLLVGLVGLILAYNLLRLLAMLSRNTSSFKLRMLFAGDIMQCLRHIPVRKFRKQRISKYVVHITDDIVHVANMVSELLPNGVTAIGRAVLLSVVIGMANLTLLLIIMGVSVTYVILGKYFGSKVRTAGRELAEKRTDVITMFEEGISSSREVVAYHREGWERARFHRQFNEYFEKVMRRVRLENQQKLITMTLYWGVLLLVLGYGGYLTIADKLSIGLFIVVFQFSTQLLRAYEEVYQTVMIFFWALPFIERVREVVEGEPEAEGTARLVENVHKLVIEDVSFKYESDGDPVLQSIHIDVPVGKKVAFVGTSGGGKSTLAHLLVRYDDPDSGCIKVNDRILSTIVRDDWLQRISVVFQEPYLFPESIRYNLLMGRQVSVDEMKDVCRKMQIHDFIESLPDGYDTDIGERGIQLSGGQRQRIALARALLMNSEILILDEATSALDLETERKVQQQLDEIRKHKTTIVIAHRLSTIEDADIIYVLSDGRVAEQGTHADLLAKGRVYPGLMLKQNDLSVNC